MQQLKLPFVLSHLVFKLLTFWTVSSSGWTQYEDVNLGITHSLHLNLSLSHRLFVCRRLVSPPLENPPTQWKHVEGEECGEIPEENNNKDSTDHERAEEEPRDVTDGG